MSEPKCPYCGDILNNQPQRKTKCPSCGNLIFVKSTPADRIKRLMTESEAKKAEAQWAEYQEKQSILRSLQAIGVSEKDVEKEQEGFLSRKSIREAYFSLLNKVANKDKNFHYRKMAHYQIALELSRKDGDFIPHLKEAAKYELLNYKHQGMAKVEILTAGKGNACAECEKQSNVVYDIERALTTMPIPCESCTHTGLGNNPGFCHCRYVVAFEDK